MADDADVALVVIGKAGHIELLRHIALHGGGRQQRGFRNLDLELGHIDLMQGADDLRMLGQTDRDGLIQRARQQFLDRLRRLQLLRLDADQPAKGGDGGVEIGLRDGIVGLAAGQRGFGLRHVGPRHFADLETVARLLQLDFQDLDVLAPQIEHRHIAQHVHIGGRALLQGGQFAVAHGFARLQHA